jgi:isopenicillin N synthase-like dioxygenase
LNKLPSIGLFFTFLFISQDPDVFISSHKKMGTEEGGTHLRINHYPKITNNIEVKPGQIRCGEHSDYGSITLLFQDDAGGLEVR